MAKKINCLIVDDEPMAREILATFVAKVPNLNLVASCANAMQAFETINENPVDLIFLDINMPEVSGLSLAKSIGKKAKIIFTTAYRDYAVDGFDLQAVDYLLKPIAFDRFLKAIHNYFDSQQHISTVDLEEEISVNHHIFVRSDRKMVKVNFNDILYLESLSDYVKIHTSNAIVITRETMNVMEGKLPSKNFIRTHRSYIVALAFVDSYTNEFVEVRKKAIPISRSYKETVLQKLAQ